MIKYEQKNECDKIIDKIKYAINNKKHLTENITAYDSDIYFDIETGTAINQSQFRPDDERYGFLINISKNIKPFNDKSGKSNYIEYEDIIISSETDLIYRLENIINILYQWILASNRSKYHNLHLRIKDVYNLSYNFLNLFLEKNCTSYVYDYVYLLFEWANKNYNKIDADILFNKSFIESEDVNNSKLINNPLAVNFISKLYVNTNNAKTIKNINMIISLWVNSNTQIEKIKKYVGNKNFEFMLYKYLKNNNISQKNVLTKQLITLKNIVDSFTYINVDTLINIYPHTPLKNKKILQRNNIPILYRLNKLDILFKKNETNLNKNDKIYILKNEFLAFESLIVFSKEIDFEDDKSITDNNYLQKLNTDLKQIKENNNITFIDKEKDIISKNILLL